MLESLAGGHPYIIKFDKTFEDTTKNILYLVMELVEGGNLESRLKNKEEANTLNEDEAVHYFLQMVTVVLYLTEHKIVHRDLKPANFLLREKNIVLIDFG